MSGNKAPALEGKTFRLEHAGKALDSNHSVLSFSVPSNGPTQLWSSCPSVNGQWVVNRGTGAYLVVEGSTVQAKIEAPYEWNIKIDGSSVRLESASQKMLLQSTQQKLALSQHPDGDSLFAIAYVAQPILSVGSEDYLDSPEHTCVTNHVFNSVNALNAIIHILEHPDKALPVDSMAVLFTRDHYNSFKARGKEATQNLDFARETVASWFTVIGAKLDGEVDKKGNVESSTRNENPALKAAEKELAELKKTHGKTETDLKDQQKKFDDADGEYDAAEAHYNNAAANESLAKGSYDDALGDLDSESSGVANSLGNIWLAKEAERKGAEEKKISRKKTRDHEEELLTPLERQSAQELIRIERLEMEVKNAKTAADDGGGKTAAYKAHHTTLTTLHGLLKNCREHLADTLQYNVAGGASLSIVREKLKGLIGVLEKGKDFKEPLKLLDRAALEHLMPRIPVINSHSSKLSN